MDRVIIDGGTPPPTPPVPAVERPTWLPEKFKTVEAFVASHAELEKKLGTPAPVIPPVPPVENKGAEAAAKAGFDTGALNKEFKDNGGKFTDATMKAFADKGITPDMVTTFTNGLRAAAQTFKTELVKVAGDEEKLKSIYKWAETNLSAEEINAYDSVVTSGDINGAKLALSGIVARFTAAHGSEPTLVSGETISTVGAFPAFESNQQIIDAMSDPRYKTDEAWRARIEKRMLHTTFLNVR